MKAFKGCVNKDCREFKKTHYKANDNFCVKCGDKLEFVCADCWTTLETNEHRHCLNCDNERKEKWDQRKETVKGLAKHSDKVLDAAKLVIANKTIREVGKKALTQGTKIVRKVK